LMGVFVFAILIGQVCAKKIVCSSVHVMFKLSLDLIN
jgi:hypothetical protein